MIAAPQAIGTEVQQQAPAPAPEPTDAGRRSNGPPQRVTSSEIDRGFEEVESRIDAMRGSGEPLGDLPGDRQQVEVLFAHMAAEHLGPFRDFLVELKLGDARREWLKICAPAVQALLAGARQLSLPELANALEALGNELALAQRSRGPALEEDARERLLVGYAELAKVLPEAFSVEAEQQKREPLIVDGILRQVPGVNTVQLDKLYAAGLTRLQQYYEAKPEDLVNTAGLGLELSQVICERFERHRRRLVSIAPEPSRKAELGQIEQLVAKLRRQNQGIEEHGRSWSKTAVKEKRKLRLARTDTLLEVQLLLARLGETQLLSRLERLAFGRKADELDKFLVRSRAERQSPQARSEA